MKYQKSNEVRQLNKEGLVEQGNPFICPSINVPVQNENILLASKKFYKKTKWANQIIQTCLDTDFQSTSLELHYGQYATNHYHSPEIQSNFIGSGQYGKVCISTFDDQICAVKMIKLEQEFFNNLRIVYKEYFIALMASQMKIGPKVINLFGYQIIFIKHYAMFGMEFCRKFGRKNQQIQILKESLDTLHSLHVVHRDIKPQNLVWSPSYQSYVFIDFGLSLVVKQKKGQKTFTSFAGSYSYCSAQMKKIFLLKESGKVDLYKNDLYAIQECKKVFLGSLFQNSAFSSVDHQIQSQNFFVNSLADVSRIKNHIYSKKYDQAQFLLKNSENIKTCLHITNKHIETNTIPKNLRQKWKGLRNTLRQKFIIKEFYPSNEDEMIATSLQKNQLGTYWSYIFLSQKHIHKFSEWSHNQMWVQRIYLMLNPTTNQYLKGIQRQQHCQLIINKIYRAAQFPPTHIFVKKIRSVLLYFFQRFKKFKKIQYLQSLSDIFILINDHLSSIKVRTFILQITNDPVQYCLQSFKYYIVNQTITLFKNPSDSQYIQKIKQKYEKLQKTTQNVRLIKFLIQIIEKLQKICVKDSQYSFYFSQIYKILQEFKKQIQDNSYLTQILLLILEKIDALNKGLNYLYVQKKIFQCLKQNIETNGEVLNILDLTKKTEEPRQKLVNQNLITKQFYSNADRKIQLDYLSKNAWIDQKRRYIEYYYELYEGNVLFFDENIFEFINRSVQLQKSFGYYVLDIQIQWLTTQSESFHHSNFYFYYFVIYRHFLIFMIIFRLKDSIKVQWLLYPNEANYFQLLAKFLKMISQKIQKFIKNEKIKDKLLFLIRIFTLARNFYYICKSTQSQLFAQFQEVFYQLKQKFDIDEQNRFYDESIFIQILGTIKNLQLFKTEENVNKFQDFFLQK